MNSSLSFDGYEVGPFFDEMFDSSVSPRPGSRQLVEHRYEKEELMEISNWWQERLRSLVHELPSEWIDNVASSLTMVQKNIDPKRKL